MKSLNARVTHKKVMSKIWIFELIPCKMASKNLDIISRINI
jgi:hypothetical protein